MRIKLIVLFLLVSSKIFAQDMDSLMNMLNEKTPGKTEYVSATFKGTRLINFHTIEVPGKRTMEFRISHHFGDINGGHYNWWGLDGGAAIRLGLEYSIDGCLQVGVGRNSYNKMYDSFLKYKLLRQTTDNAVPLSVTLLSGMYYTILKDPNAITNGFDRYQYHSNRLSYTFETIMARKFSERFSLQLAPTLVHYNLVEKKSDVNDLFLMTFAARYKYTKRAALCVEYAYRINKGPGDIYFNPLGIGIDIDTGGHVFQVYLTNSIGMVEPQYFGHTETQWQKFAVKLGFNISRMFSI